MVLFIDMVQSYDSYYFKYIYKMTNEPKKSDCCGAEIKIHRLGNFGNYAVGCTKCKKPCEMVEAVSEEVKCKCQICLKMVNRFHSHPLPQDEAKDLLENWEKEVERRMTNLVSRGHPKALYMLDIKEIILQLLAAQRKRDAEIVESGRWNSYHTSLEFSSKDITKAQNDGIDQIKFQILNQNNHD
jgi:hypothetical protein